MTKLPLLKRYSSVISGLGLKNLRTARTVKENMVLTVEPGCYFIDHVLGKKNLPEIKMELYYSSSESMITSRKIRLKFNISDSAMQDPELAGFFVQEKIAEYRGFGGVRIEDDIIITKDGCEVIHILNTK